MKRKFFLSFLFGLVIFGGAYTWVWHQIEGGFTAVQAIEEEAGIEQVENIEEGNEIEQIDVDEILFLLVGVDTSELKNIEVKKNGETGIRSDTMILCKVNFRDGTINMMSLPRDSRVPVKGHKERLAHAHSYGGMNLLMQTVREVTNLDVDYYARVDYEAVEKLVDAVGGVEIDVPQKMYKDGGVYLIDLEKGKQVLDGEGAIMFLRFRDYKKGDIERVAMQQYFLKEMIKQTLTPKNILRLPQILNVYSTYIDTNIDTSIIYSGMKAASNLDADKIESTTLPGDFLELEENGTLVSYWKVFPNTAKKEIERLFGDYLMDGDEKQ